MKKRNWLNCLMVAIVLLLFSCYSKISYAMDQNDGVENGMELITSNDDNKDEGYSIAQNERDSQTGLVGDKANMDKSESVYLSDLPFKEATHGDADRKKEVQRDVAFSRGNNGNKDKIALKMSDGSVRKFDKGIGTIASNPSVISFDIKGKGYSQFESYLGIDQSANAFDKNYATIEKIDVLVDHQIRYTTLTDYPQGMGKNDGAAHVAIQLPQNASLLELRSYAGSHTWGDEVVFADPKLIVEKENASSVIRPDDLNTGMKDGVYLSDLNWVSASHGDADLNKRVQKDHPFTLGNASSSNKMLLNIDSQNVQFKKGIGTVAGNPSRIVYDISEAGVERFISYVGIDRNRVPQDERYANVEAVEVWVDGKQLFNSRHNYPNGIRFDTPAFLINEAIPNAAKRFELKVYSGHYTWGDELNFAGAMFIAKGVFKDPNAIAVKEKRREISNTHPLLMMPLYANGEAYNEGRMEFWGGDTLYGKWENIAEDIRPYVAIQLHPDDLPKKDGVLQAFYENLLEKARNHVDPKTGKADPIPIILTVYTAGNMSYYTSAHWLQKTWIDEMYHRYDNLIGIFSTENYWVWAKNIEQDAADYLRISAKNGGYFIWAEQNNGGSIEKIFGRDGQRSFAEATKKYSDNFIFMFKNTPANEGNDAPTLSYMKGLWLAKRAYQWGGLMDTWKWYETGKWRLFEKESIGKSQGNRQWLTEPEAMLGQEALTIYLNGGCVYNFEHPAYTYGVKDKESPLFNRVIKPLFRYIVQHPTLNREQIMKETKVILHGDFSRVGDGKFFTGWAIDQEKTPLYATGRYGVIPALPKSIDSALIQNDPLLKGAKLIELDSEEMRTANKRKKFFDSLYTSTSKGELFVQKMQGSWFISHTKVNENVKQKGEFVDGEIQFAVDLEPHTFMIVEEYEGTIDIRLDNFRTNKDALWQGAKTANEAKKLPNFNKKEALKWVEEYYIDKTAWGEKRETIIVLKNLNRNPMVKLVEGEKGSYDQPLVSYDANKKEGIVTIKNNGYIHFTI